MERKTIDRSRLIEFIELNRQMLDKKKDISEIQRKLTALTPQGDEFKKWMSIREILGGIFWGIKTDATNEQIFKVFQILGYDIV